MLGAIEDLVRRGRARGLGITLISQRSAVLNKDVLTQAEVLVALRMTSPRDRRAVDEWVKLHAEDDAQRDGFPTSLPSMPVGEAGQHP
jgi:DNA helicase HerA-like ATPase